jgi:hypothetical protein
MAWAVAADHKPIENRPWKPYQGVTHVAIHAGARYDHAHANLIAQIMGRAPPPEARTHGAILAVARLAGYTLGDPSPWFSGPFGWLLEDVEPLDPVIVRPGALGLWRLIPEELANIRGQLPDLPWGRGEQVALL